MASESGESEIDIEQLIPHRPPMRLVERLRPIDDDTAETVSIVRETWPGVEDGHVQSIVLVELFAQSAAALMGCRERPATTPRAHGLLVGVPQAQFAHALVPVGLRLRCWVHIARGLGGYCAFDGKIEDDTGQIWLEASIQAFRPSDDEILTALTAKKGS